MNNNDLNSMNLNNPESNLNNINNVNPEANMANPSMNATMDNQGMQNVSPMSGQPQNNVSSFDMNNAGTYNVNPNQGIVGDGIDNTPKKGKKGIVVLVALLVVVLIGGVVGFFVYKNLLMSNPSSITANLFKEMAKEATTAINDYNKELERIKNINNYSSQISIEAEGYAADFDVKLNLNDKIMSLVVDASKDNEDLLNLDGVITTDTLYFSLLKDSASTYSVDVSDADIDEIFEEVSKETLTLNPVMANLVKYLGESFEESIKKDDFSETTETLTIDGKDVSVKKYNLGVSSKALKPFVENYKNKLINDEELLKELVLLYNNYEKMQYGEFAEEITVSDLKEMIKDELTIADEDVNDDIVFNYALYVKGSDLLKIELYDEDFKMEFDLSKDFVFRASDDTEMLTIKMTEEKITFNYNNGDDVSIDGEYSLKDGKYDFVMESYGSEIGVNGVLKDNSTEDKTDLELTVNLDMDGTEYSGKLKVVSENPSALDIEIPSGALDVNDEYNATLLLTEIQQMPIYPVLESIMNNLMYTDDDYDYDYDYDYEYDSNYDFDTEFDF